MTLTFGRRGSQPPCPEGTVLRRPDRNPDVSLDVQDFDHPGGRGSGAGLLSEGGSVLVGHE
ncbi:hypothetical protein Adu01nite_62360 [Paractinoplanes durhamensis]|uniref:Uncharacterized protein n=1 Tax=Paractinoplanes durhamensis TaxID=113563 RepID=A0ABQ3Z500_9ACTN|nr:hypothetical protein Adu01nite_62360 [Actinoplanes durhamensis]